MTRLDWNELRKKLLLWTTGKRTLWWKWAIDMENEITDSYISTLSKVMEKR